MSRSKVIRKTVSRENQENTRFPLKPETVPGFITARPILPIFPSKYSSLDLLEESSIAASRAGCGSRVISARLGVFFGRF